MLACFIVLIGGQLIAANKLLSFIETAVNKNRIGLFTPVAGNHADRLVRSLSKLTHFSTEEIEKVEWGAELLQHATEVLEAKHAKALATKAENALARNTNRCTYLYTGSMAVRAAKSTGQAYWRYDFDLESPGLMHEVLRSDNPMLTRPVAIQLFNRLPPLMEDGKVVAPTQPVDEEEWTAWETLGYNVSKAKVAWHWESVSAWMLRMFPKAIDYTAYNHRLRAPLIPGGYLQPKAVVFQKQMSYSTGFNMSDLVREVMGGAPENLKPIEQGVDGSGLWDPTHPDCASIAAAHGAAVLQITLVGANGLFAKGILVPREGCAVDNCGWVFDHKQVKGALKGSHDTTDTVKYEGALHLGIMRTWRNPSTLPLGFEQLECIQVRGEKDFTKILAANKRIKTLAEELLTENMGEFFKGGIGKIIARLCRENQELKTIIDFVARANQLGCEINPMSLKGVESAVEDALQRALWPFNQGGGIMGRQLVVVHDNAIPEGMVVAPRLHNRTCAVWRWPTVLPCGLLTLEPMEALPHHKVNGEVIANTCWLNPRDVLKMQGDDDGDIVGLSQDPRVVELFNYRYDNRFFIIESDGVKLNISTDSEEGRQYGRWDPRGPVGITTIARSKLLACQDFNGALAVSVLNQEVIDSAKKAPNYTDYRKASVESNWKLCEDACWRIHWSTDGTNYGPYGKYPHKSENFLNTNEFPGEDLNEWVKHRMNLHGVHEKVNPLGWRVHWRRDNITGQNVRLNKRVPITNWRPCADKQGEWSGGNLVHFVSDKARELWKAEQKAFLGDTEDVQLADLLPRVLRACGFNIKPNKLSTAAFKALRDKSGITAYNKELKTILTQKTDDEESVERRLREINLAGAELQSQSAKLSLQEQLDLWVAEATPLWFKKERGVEEFSEEPFEGYRPFNKPLNAIKVVCAPGGKTMAALGITPPETCKFLTLPQGAITKLESATNFAISKPEPLKELQRLVFENTSHAQTISEDGEPVSFWQCSHCRTTLENSVIRGIREARRRVETEILNELCGSLREQPRGYQYAVIEEPDLDMSDFI